MAAYDVPRFEGFLIRDSSGRPVSGDPEFEDHMRKHCDKLGGWVEDGRTGEVVYESPHRRSVKS